MGRLMIVWLIGVGVSAAASAEPALKRFELSQTEMAIPIRIVLYAADNATAAKAAEAAFSRFHQLNAILSDYDPQSELRRLCDTSVGGKAVHVSDDLWRVLVRAQQLSERSAGGVRRHDRPGGSPLAQCPADERTPLARVDPKGPVAGRLPVRSARPSSGRPWNCSSRTCVWTWAESPRDTPWTRRWPCSRKHGITRMMVDAGGNIGLGDPPPEQAGLADRHCPARRAKPAARVSLAFPRARSPPPATCGNTPSSTARATRT